VRLIIGSVNAKQRERCVFTAYARELTGKNDIKFTGFHGEKLK
jgi:hypothetical protein